VLQGWDSQSRQFKYICLIVVICTETIQWHTRLDLDFGIYNVVNWFENTAVVREMSSDINRDILISKFKIFMWRMKTCL
jgi:hypothetical protein